MAVDEKGGKYYVAASKEKKLVTLDAKTLLIALKPEAAGQEIEGPMAIVILGGLVSSTILILLLLPALALKFGRFGRVDSAAC